MRQRNDTPHAWSFAATPATETTPEVPPFVVQPGETTDRPVLLDGWTAVGDEQSDADADKTDKQPPARKRAAADDSKGGESK